MTIKGLIHSKMLQVYFSQEHAIALANEGEAVVPVFFQDGSKVGEVTITATPLTRLSLLVHLDKPYPEWLSEAATRESERYTREV